MCRQDLNSGQAEAIRDTDELPRSNPPSKTTSKETTFRVRGSDLGGKEERGGALASVLGSAMETKHYYILAFLKQNMMWKRKNNTMPRATFTVARPLMTTGIENPIITRVMLTFATPLAEVTKRYFLKSNTKRGKKI
ncbi:hypothetical protein AVEN_196322-1 [Araneus ventricosus]|uniref:Uncharacterized protein n=1 Tax=Araneus ventricosus TaxID=182803 RepID=A0A4Y2ATX2_ARAVE|nr:hypothetical protein AVEN_196322-1 [Araneus ventricosus]